MNNTVDISTFSITELKALAFDLNSEMAHIRQNLDLVNKQLIEKLQMQTPGEVIAEVKEDSAETSETVVDKSE